MKTLFIDTLEIAVPMSFLIGILLLMTPLIKKSIVAKWRYYMWLFVALRLIFPFKIYSLPAPITVEIPSGISAAAFPVETAAKSGLSLQTILMIVWIAGMAVFALYQLTGYIAFKKNVRRWAKRISDEKTVGVFDEIRASLGIKRSLRFMSCKTVSTPMVFGLINPVLLLPHCEYGEKELGVILRHELVHFKRNDILYKLILLCANAICWFNPLVYKMVSSANRDIEISCDAEVVREENLEYRRDYCRAILSVVHNKKSMSAPLSTCFIISKEGIRERFADILDLKRKRKGIILFSIVALSVLVSGSLVTFATAKTARVLEDDLNIVDRPEPKSEPTLPPAEETTDEDMSDGYADENDPYDDYADFIYEADDEYEDSGEAPSDGDTAVGGAPSAEEEIPRADADRRKVNLREQSSSINIQFDEQGGFYRSSSSFTSDEDTSMNIVSDKDVTVRVTDDTTGEIVYEREMTADDNTAEIPIKAGGEYSVSALGDARDESAELYIYGK